MKRYQIMNDGHIEYFKYNELTKEIYSKYLFITKDWPINDFSNVLFSKFKFCNGYKKVHPIIFINEIFLPYPNNDRYWVSNFGNVIDTYSRILKTPFITNKGYLRIFIYRNKEDKIYHNNAVHRMVAETFMPIPNSNLWFINHKNSNKLCNSINNLEWCNNSYNIQHAYDHNLENKVYSDEIVKTTYSLLLQGIKPHDIANYLGIIFNHAFSSFCHHLKKGDRRMKVLKSINS